MNAVEEMACATPACDNRGKPCLNIVGYGSFATKSGRRRRYRCTVCRGTLSANTGTAYSGLRCTRREFDQVASLRVEGVNISATARVTSHSRNTIARWLKRASNAAERFNDRIVCDAAMQAGLVSTRLAMSDIFTGRRVTLRVLVALVETGAAECPTSLVAATNNESLPDQQRAAQAPLFALSAASTDIDVRPP